MRRNVINDTGIDVRGTQSILAANSQAVCPVIKIIPVLNLMLHRCAAALSASRSVSVDKAKLYLPPSLKAGVSEDSLS